MAIPPEPIEELLPSIAQAFAGEVVEVVHTGEQPPIPPHEPGATSVGIKAPRQVVKLEVKEVLTGDLEVGAIIEAIKPEAGYALREGNHGPFLLDGGTPQPTILGRYGPDSYSSDKLRAVLGAGR